MFKLIVFLSCVTLALSLICYDCDPSSESQCLNPDKNNIKETNCEEVVTERTGFRIIFKRVDSSIITTTLEPKPKTNFNDEVFYDCVSLYFTPEENSEKGEGVYRGCVKRTNKSKTACDVAKGKLEAGNVTQCSECSEDRCNKNAPGGAAGVTISMVTLLITTLFSFRTIVF